MISRVLSLFALLFLTDLIIYSSIRRYSFLFWKGAKYIKLRKLHLAISFMFLAGSVIFFLFLGDPGLDVNIFRKYFYWTDTFLLLYLPKLLLAVLCLLGEFAGLAAKKHKTRILKSFLIAGVSMACITFCLIVYGLFFGTKAFTVKQLQIYSSSIPAEFDGFRIAQISDVHLGSWRSPNGVAKGLEILQACHPDLIVLSGDLVNILAEESEPYIGLFARLKASYGKFSTLGNHDVGDFTKLTHINVKDSNIVDLKKNYQSMGFKLLSNENVIIRKGKDSFALIGIDNWSLFMFKRYGDVKKAISNTEGVPFKIMISHDPSCWRSEIVKKTDVNLTLSGHTHGMQLGINFPWFKWSPIAAKYPEWLGLYHEGQQALYINAGFGFLGFSGRVGIRPEISLITLKREVSHNPLTVN